MATGKAFGVQQDKVRRGLQGDRALAKLISAIEADLEQRKSKL